VSEVFLSKLDDELLRGAVRKACAICDQISAANCPTARYLDTGISMTTTLPLRMSSGVMFVVVLNSSLSYRE